MKIVKKKTMDESGSKETMISNLPLLFANGYPTSLEKIAENQLENFIPFMVQCSYGKINLQSNETMKPEWWPEDVAFEKPFRKPSNFHGNWLEAMKNIVLKCYSHHQSEFLINFCKDLTVYDHASLRFINNFNSTTSLFERRSNRLLVTFRNENMSYDQGQRSRMCLMQKPQNNGIVEVKMMVESSPFEIYLCDNCDAELYSEDAMREHEKMCMSDDDDVIFCESPQPDDSAFRQTPDRTSISCSIQSKERGTSSRSADNDVADSTSDQYKCSSVGGLLQNRPHFLLNFDLQPNGCTQTLKQLKEASTRDDDPVSSNSNNKTNNSKKRMGNRKNRYTTNIMTLGRCPLIPFSSPAGQALMKKSKTVVNNDYLNERLDRIERFCSAPVVITGLPRPAKYFDRRIPSNITSNFKNKSHSEYDYIYERVYKYPKRKFSTKKREEDLKYVNELLWKQCRPLCVRLKKIEGDHKTALSPPSSAKLLNIKLTRDARKSSKWKISPSNSFNTSTSTEIVVDTIDLCSSDDEDKSSGISTESTTDCENEEPNSKRLCYAAPLIENVLKNLSPDITLTPLPGEEATNNNFLSRFKGNFVMSPTSEITFPEITSSSEVRDVMDKVSLLKQNQENVDDNSRQKHITKRRSDVLPEAKKKLSTGASANNTLPIMPFNSPNRIVSIDLT